MRIFNKIAYCSLSVFLLAGAIFSVPAAHAQTAKCDPLPKVEWWSQTHEKVNAVVAKSYKGDWAAYIKRWEGYQTSMQKTLDAKGEAVVKSRGIKLTGELLENHVKQIGERLEVLRCLQGVSEDSKSTTQIKTERQETELVAKKSSVNRAEEVASISEKNLEVEVVAKCDQGSTVFTITNLGAIWPRLASINIYKLDTKAVVSKRRVKLKNSQQATFKISAKKSRDSGGLGIWIEPSWLKREFKYDVTQSCG